MKDTSPTIATYSGLQDAYDFYNDRLFNGELPDCVITYQRQNNSYGYHCGKRWGNSVGEKTDEIAMNPAYLATRPVDETLSTLVHEMCHGWQAYKGTPGRGGYHNKEFARMMQEVGLIAYSVDDPSKNVGDRVTHRIEPGGAFAVVTEELISSGFSFPWVDLAFRGEDRAGGLSTSDIEAIRAFGIEVGEPGAVQVIDKPRSGARVKYSCPSGHYSVWGKSDIDPMCGQCKEYMTPE